MFYKNQLSRLCKISANILFKSEFTKQNGVFRQNHPIFQLRFVHDENQQLSKSRANELILKLNEEERSTLLNALHEFESNRVKAEYEGQLAAVRWRSKFGRPSKLPTLGDVDPTGSYCHLSDDWLKTKYEKSSSFEEKKEGNMQEDNKENVLAPTLHQLLYVAFFNAVPFIGFGFLDNAIMIIAGDYIELWLGSIITISTMAAAALGNTISDILGIGSAWYVELIASKIGLKPPNLSPIQLDMKPSRRFINLVGEDIVTVILLLLLQGRALGITVGCLLGMVPLLFMNKEPKKSTDD